jgi:hypothetical protein
MPSIIDLCRWPANRAVRRPRPQRAARGGRSPDGGPPWAVHDSAQLAYVERDEDGGYDGAGRLAF